MGGGGGGGEYGQQREARAAVVRWLWQWGQHRVIRRCRSADPRPCVERLHPRQISEQRELFRKLLLHAILLFSELPTAGPPPHRIVHGGGPACPSERHRRVRVEERVVLARRDAPPNALGEEAKASPRTPCRILPLHEHCRRGRAVFRRQPRWRGMRESDSSVLKRGKRGVPHPAPALTECFPPRGDGRRGERR